MRQILLRISDFALSPFRFLFLLSFFAMAAHARPRETVLFIGSSTIANWGTLQRDFPLVRTINSGIGGTTYADLYRFSLAPLQRYHLDKIVLYSGDNDVAAGASPEQVGSDFSRVLDRIRRRAPNAEIFVIGIKPSPGRWNLLGKFRAANKLIERIARRTPNVTYVDVDSKMLDATGHVRTDLFDPTDEMHIHLNSTGYRLWSSILGPYVMGHSVMPSQKHLCESALATKLSDAAFSR